MINTFYDRGYNTRIGVQNEDAIFERWRTESEAARNTLRCHLDLRYGEANRETIDLFPVAESARWLVFIHGGYWRMMTKESSSLIAPPFVAAGWNVAIVEYDLCPAVTVGTITEQCRRAIAWLYQHAGEYSAGCDEMVISGHSAGGHLTGMMFAADWPQYGMPTEVISGGIAISGLFDLDPITQTNINEDVRLTPEDIYALSPSRLQPYVTAPMVVTVGALESSEFHRQGNLIKGAPGWQNVATEQIAVEGCHHFNILDVFMDVNSEIWAPLHDNR